MKPDSPTALTAAIATLLITPAFAIEAPADNAPAPKVTIENAAAEVKPAEPGKPAAAPAPKAAEQAGVAFLGVGTTEIPDLLAEHLDLKHGEGLLVNSLQADGPAEKAGIAVNDIITRIAGKPVESTIDLGEKVRAHKPGETLRVDVIHKGKPAGLDIKLAARPDNQGEVAGNDAAEAMPLPGMPKEMQDRIQEMKKKIGAMQLQLGGIGGANPIPGAPGMGRIEIHQGASFRLIDPQGSVELKSNNDGKEVTVRGQDDKVVWSGPWDTEQDKAAAPDDVRKRIDRLNIDQNQQRGALRLNMGGMMIPPPPPVPQPEDAGEEQP